MMDLERPNAPTHETQQKVREIIKNALKKQKDLHNKGKVNNEPAVIDILSYMVDEIAGTKRVLYSLAEFTGTNYSAMYHLAHAKQLHKDVIMYLKKELKFLAPDEVDKVNENSK